MNKRIRQLAFSILLATVFILPAWASVKTVRGQAPASRSLSIPGTVQAQTAEPPAANPDPSSATVRGYVINQNQADKSTAGFEVMLHIFDAVDQSSKGMLHGTTAQDGSYTITGVPAGEELGFVAMAVYEDVTYQSEPIYTEAGQTDIRIDVPVYESSTDASGVQADQVHVLFKFAQDGLEVKQLYLLSNLGGRTVREAFTLPDGQKATLRFAIPENADFVNFQTDNQARFVKFEGGFGDLQPLKPGTNTGQILVSYLIPYTTPMVFPFETTLTTNNVSIILPENSGVTISGEGLGEGQAQTMPDDQTYIQYSTGNLAAGTRREITFSGKPNIPGALEEPPADSPPAAAPDSSIPLIFGSGILGVSMIGLGIWWWRRSKHNAQQDQEVMLALEQTAAENPPLDAPQESELLEEGEPLTTETLTQQAPPEISEEDTPVKPGDSASNEQGHINHIQDATD